MLKAKQKVTISLFLIVLNIKDIIIVKLVFCSQSLINFLIKVSIIVTCSLWKCWLWWSFSTPFATSPSILSGWEYLNISMSQYEWEYNYRSKIRLGWKQEMLTVGLSQSILFPKQKLLPSLQSNLVPTQSLLTKVKWSQLRKSMQ